MVLLGRGSLLFDGFIANIRISNEPADKPAQPESPNYQRHNQQWRHRAMVWKETPQVVIS